MCASTPLRQCFCQVKNLEKLEKLEVSGNDSPSIQSRKERNMTQTLFVYIQCARGVTAEQARPTFLQRSSLVLLQPLDCDGFQAYSGSRVLLEHVPHILLAEHEEVRVADRAHAGCSPVTCVDVAIYWLSGCIKLSYVTAHTRSIGRSYHLPPRQPRSRLAHVVPDARAFGRAHVRASSTSRLRAIS